MLQTTPKTRITLAKTFELRIDLWKKSFSSFSDKLEIFFLPLKTSNEGITLTMIDPNTPPITFRTN